VEISVFCGNLFDLASAAFFRRASSCALVSGFLAVAWPPSFPKACACGFFMRLSYIRRSIVSRVFCVVGYNEQLMSA
jgi:hypothetical protein